VIIVCIGILYLGLSNNFLSGEDVEINEMNVENMEDYNNINNNENVETKINKKIETETKDLDYVLRSDNVSQCVFLGESEVVNCENVYYYKKAELTDDGDFCLPIPSEDVRSECLNKYAN
ncbi:MAG: hypothetical protein KC589_08980, partial [Nanoarchaeota archaeon]|nr:hypothetical protein [Nanoarchaeota archaeon]